MAVQKAAKVSLPLCAVILCFGFYWMAVYKRESELEQPRVKPGTYNKGKFLYIQPHRVKPQKLAETRTWQLKRKLQNRKLLLVNQTRTPEVNGNGARIKLKPKSTPDPKTRLFQQATDLRQRCNSLKKDGLYQEPKITKWWKNSRWNIFVLDKYKVLFCVIPRAASTSSRRLLLTLEGRLKEASDLDVGRIHQAGEQYLKTFRNYSVEEVQQRIKQYTKVLVVREPMERLLSAYRAQFEGATLENVNKFYNLHLQKVPNFPEFICYLLNRIKVGVGESHQLDAHWNRLEFMSQPCTIQYDMVVRFERLEEDMNLLIKQLHWENVLHFPTRHASGYVNNKTNTLLVEYYSQVPKFQRDKLKKFYSRDYSLFGYTYPQVLNQL